MNAIESRNHACNSVADIWLCEPRRRFRRAALVSPLKSYWGIVPFVVYKLFGYSLLARPLSRRFWTVSEWNNEVSLRAFVQHPPHVRIMTALGPHMDKTKFVQWTVKGSQLPLKWDDALPQLAD